MPHRLLTIPQLQPHSQLIQPTVVDMTVMLEAANDDARMHTDVAGEVGHGSLREVPLVNEFRVRIGQNEKVARELIGFPLALVSRTVLDDQFVAMQQDMADLVKEAEPEDVGPFSTVGDHEDGL